MEKLLAGIGALILVALVLVVASVVSGFVFSYLWEWFIVAKFGLPALSIAEAIGLSLTIGWVAKTNKGYTSKEDKEHEKERAVAAILLPLMAFLVGWILTFFI